MIRNRNIDSLREQRVIPWNEFNVTTGTASGGAGAVTYEELSSFAYGGIGVTASGDEFSALDLVTPTRMDPRHEIGARIIWTVEGTVATDDAVLWQVRYDQCVIAWNVEAGTVTQFGANEAVFLGLIIDYIPLWTVNPIEQDSGALTVDLTAA